MYLCTVIERMITKGNRNPRRVGKMKNPKTYEILNQFSGFWIKATQNHF